MHDISAEKRPADERAFHAALLDSLQDPVMATDERWVVTAWNRGAQQMFGWSAADALGQPVFELLPQAYSEHQQGEEMQELARTGRWRGERTWYAKDGTEVRADAVTTAVRGDDDGVTGYVCAMRPSACGDETEFELEGSSVLENISDAFYALSPDWRITYINSQAVRFAAQLAGRPLTRREVLGQTLWELLPLTRGTLIEERYRRAQREQQPIAFEYRYPGDETWFDVHAYPSAQGLAIYFRDISDRKRDEHLREAQSRQQAAIAELGCVRWPATTCRQPSTRRSASLPRRWACLSPAYTSSSTETRSCSCAPASGGERTWSGGPPQPRSGAASPATRSPRAVRSFQRMSWTIRGSRRAGA